MTQTWRGFCELLRSAPDGSLPVPGLDWTVGELGAHLVSGARLWRRMLAGEASPVTSLVDGASHTARMIEGLPERDPVALSELIDNEIGATLGELNRRPADQAYPWHAGLQLTMAQASAIGLGELVVHGFDLARALHKPWPIDRRDARYVIYGASAILPAAVDHAQAAGFSVCSSCASDQIRRSHCGSNRRRTHGAARQRLQAGLLCLRRPRRVRAPRLRSSTPVALPRLGEVVRLGAPTLARSKVSAAPAALLTQRDPTRCPRPSRSTS